MHPAGPVAIVFTMLLIGCVLYALANPDSFYFLTKGNASLVLRAIPNFGIIALGVGLLMISGEFDLRSPMPTPQGYRSRRQF